MKISGMLNPNEEKEVKAFINLDVNGFTMHGFKVIEKKVEDKIQVSVAIPSYLVKNEKGEAVKDKEGNNIYKHPIIINNNNDVKKLMEKLTEVVVNAYNEGKEKGEKQFNKEISVPELEKGELNVIDNFNFAKSAFKNPDYVMKSTNTVMIGAFKINEVNLLWNAKKNDFTIIPPSYEAKDEEGKDVKKSFLVANDKATYSSLKDKVVNAYKEKSKAFQQQMSQQQAQTQQQNQEQSAPTEGQGLTH